MQAPGPGSIGKYRSSFPSSSFNNCQPTPGCTATSMSRLCTAYISLRSSESTFQTGAARKGYNGNASSMANLDNVTDVCGIAWKDNNGGMVIETRSFRPSSTRMSK